MGDLVKAPEIVVADPIVVDIRAGKRDIVEAKLKKANTRLAKAGIEPRFTATYEPFEKKVRSGGIDLEDGTIFGGTEVVEDWLRVTLNELRITSGHYTFVAALVAEEAGYTVHCAPGQNLDGWQVHLSDPTDEEAPTPGLPEVVGSSANTEVAGLNTNGSIAGMKDKETVGDFSNEDSVGDSVGSITTINTGSNLSVSGAIGSASPVPTDITVGGITHGEKEGLLQGEATRGSLGDFSTAVPVESGVVPKTESPGFHLGVAPAHRAHHANRVPVCDHCNLKRDRKRLYIVRDDRDGSLHQIGHSCIELYTGLAIKGLWALEFDQELKGLEDEDDGYYGGGGEARAPLDIVLGLAFSFADEGRQYISVKAAECGVGEATGSQVRSTIFWPPRQPTSRDPRVQAAWREYVAKVERGYEFAKDEALIADIKAAADTLAPGTDYADNMHTILAGEYVSQRGIGTLASLVAVYAREKELAVKREQEKKAPPAQGLLAPVKTRLRGLELVLTKVKSFEGQYGTKTLLEGREAGSHVVVWWATGDFDYAPGDTIVIDATVKELKPFQGVDQTVVTNGRLKGHTPAEEAVG